jgi:hypothetical protein
MSYGLYTGPGGTRRTKQGFAKLRISRLEAKVARVERERDLTGHGPERNYLSSRVSAYRSQLKNWRLRLEQLEKVS